MTKYGSHSERIEREEQSALCNSATDSVKQKLGLRLVDVGGIVCSVSSAEKSILINRCFVTQESALSAVENILAVKQVYKDAGIEEFFMHVPESKEETIHNLEKAGMKMSRGWMKFRRGLESATARNPELDIREIGPEYAEDFARIVVPCFDLNEVTIPLLAGFVHHPNIRYFLGFDDGVPVATGSLFVKNGIGHLDFGSTHRDHRGKGFQGAMLAHRINEAIAMEVKELYTATGEAVPGDPQHSYKNIMRYGFKEYYLRQNWVPA